MVRTTAELEGIAGEWRALWQADIRATPFQSPEWLLPWWHHFGQRDLRTITIRERSDLIGLLPLYIYPDPRSGKRQLLPIGVGTSDYLDGIFAPACTAEHLRQGLHALQEKSGWDEICFSQLRSDSPLLKISDRQAFFPTEACLQSRATRISDLPRKLRQNVNYYRNRSERIGSIAFNVADENSCVTMFEILRRFQIERWQQNGHQGVFADPRVPAWHREALPGLARAGLLRLCSLSLNDETIAVMYSLVDPPEKSHRTQYIYLPGFSLRHAELRPGTLLQAMAMEHAASEGIEAIDMLRGNEPYKQLWHPETQPTYGFVVYPRSAYQTNQWEKAA